MNKVRYLALGLFIHCFIFDLSAYAAKPLIQLNIGAPRIKRSRIAYPSIRYEKGSQDELGYLRLVHDVTVEDLTFSGLFDFISPEAFIEQSEKSGVKKGSFKFSDWSKVGSQFLIKAKGKVIEETISLEVYLYAVSSGVQLLSKRYSSSSSALRKLAHTISNDIFYAFTGKRGPFTAKIAFVSDVTGNKEIYIMDYDGNNRVQVTNRQSTTMAPAWSPDGKSLIFSSVDKNSENVENHNLYIYHMPTGQVKLISNRKGLNSGAQYHPNSGSVILTMSFLGNPEIFTMNPNNKTAKRITNSFGVDVDPSYNVDGKWITFVSDRSGRSMIYKMRSDGSKITRLTYAGKYNATPSWSPSGYKIAFAGWNRGKFDIFIMNQDGTTLERLTKNMGNNEDPHFAPDGYFIVYSSNRKGKKDLYITNTDNSAHVQITRNFGNCEAPKWSPLY